MKIKKRDSWLGCRSCLGFDGREVRFGYDVVAAVVGAGEVRPLAVVGAAQPVRAISVHTLAVPVTVPLLRVAFALGVETAVVATTAVNALSTLF